MPDDLYDAGVECGWGFGDCEAVRDAAFDGAAADAAVCDGVFADAGRAVIAAVVGTVAGVWANAFVVMDALFVVSAVGADSTEFGYGVSCLYGGLWGQN